MDTTHPIPLVDRRVVPRPIWAIAPALVVWGYILESFGIVLMCAGIALLLDGLVVLWRTRGLTATLEVPFSGQVGSNLTFRIRLDTDSGATVTSRVGLGAADAVPRPGWIQQSGETADAPITPSHRGRFDELRVTAAHRGAFGIDIVRHDFIFRGPPAFSVGPVEVHHHGVAPALIKTPMRHDDNLSPTSAADPILRPWQLGDRTSSIDWRRFERLDELVVRSSPSVRDDVIIVCNLGDESTSDEAADREAGKWASLARQHLSRGRVALVWREQDATHVRVVEVDDDIAWVLAGASPGVFDSEVLHELGIDQRPEPDTADENPEE